MKRLHKSLSGTLAIGGLVGIHTTEGTVHLGFPTGAEIVLTPKG